MSTAADTAGRVLHWAIAPQGAPPPGPAFGLADLLTPLASLCRAVIDLAAREAARVGLGAEAFGAAPGPAPGPGPGAIWLAAAVGLRTQPALAAELLHDLPPAATSWQEAGWDSVARHGLAAPALRWLPPALAEAVRAASPLTALLCHPAGGEADRVLVFCRTLLGVKPACQPAVAAFADPQAGTKELEWRAEALGRLLAGARPCDRAFLLDVTETAVTWHREAWLERLRESAFVLQSPAPAPDAEARALATGRWWQPLRALRQAEPEAIRGRRYLDFQVYWRGLQLAAVTDRLYR